VRKIKGRSVVADESALDAEPIHPGQVQVNHRTARNIRVMLAQELFGVRIALDTVTFRREKPAKRRKHSFIVVDQVDCCLNTDHGLHL
jgi:hypothetical protein